jgi:uncharacterized protein
MIDPLVLFFVMGVLARLAKSDLRLPEALYETLSIYLLLAIGLKGGAELAKHPAGDIVGVGLAAMVLSAAIALLAYPVLRFFAQRSQVDAAAIAAHYGSVSVVTFAVAQGMVASAGLEAEPQMVVLVALMETPGIIIGILLAKAGGTQQVNWRALGHETLLGKAVYLLIGGIVIGAIAGPAGLAPIKPLFTDLFKGVLALFLLEMGLVAGGRLGDLKRAGWRLVSFGLLAPFVFAAIGLGAGYALNLSVGGQALLAALCASASYIAAPTAMRMAVPEANPALSIGMSLGMTFPMNVTIGIPIYIAAAQWLNR